MDPVFTETNAEIWLSPYAQGTSFVKDHGDYDEELDDSGKKDIGEYTIKTYEQNMAVDDEVLDSTEENPVLQEAPDNKRKTLVAAHKKSKKVRSNK